MNIIPDRKEFKKIEVERITSLSGKVLDYWEVEFAAFSPKNKNGEKIYLYEDVTTILKIKQYLTVDKLNKDQIKTKLFQKINNNKNLKIVKKTTEINKINPKNTSEKKEDRQKHKKSNKDRLDLLKHNLLDILTILGNNDKK